MSSFRQPDPGGGASSSPAHNDPYLVDDFVPLRSAGDAVLRALRDDETSPDADLYRRIVSSGPGSHFYYPAPPPHGEGGGIDGIGGSSTSATATQTDGGQTAIGGSTYNSTGLLRGNLQTPGSVGNGAVSAMGTAASPSGEAAPPPMQPPASTVDHDRSFPLPSYLAKELEGTRLASLMGLLSEANLAWLSVDDKLFIWSYEEGSFSSSVASWGASSGTAGLSGPEGTQRREDFCSFTIPSGQCIVSVGLVRPKKGVFKDVVEWCLVVTTPEEVILCALARESTDASASPPSTNSFGHGPDTLLRLIPTRFVIPTDSVPMISVCGTSAGRIFLGGYDGCLYEMTYDGFLPNELGGAGNAFEDMVHDFYDGDGTYVPSLMSSSYVEYLSVGNVTKTIVKGSKRALSAVVFGSQSNGDSVRARKCRKINHSSVASGLVAAVMPGAALRVAAALFGGGTSTGGGPIVSMVIDDERSCLYTLSSRGYICAFDVFPQADNSRSSSTAPSSASPFGGASNVSPRLACVMDAPKSARLYLDSVSRGRMYPPSSHSTNIASITFPGGGSSAQAGIGGMEGARNILKRHDAEVQRGYGSSRGSSFSTNRKNSDNFAGILHPVSIHLIRRRESRSLTLVAITGGGLRYYLSVLSPAAFSAAPGYGSNRDDLLRPGKKFTLCHVRAPPPYKSGEDRDNFRLDFTPSETTGGYSVSGAGGGIAPRIGEKKGGKSSVGDVVKSYYSGGITILALDSGNFSASSVERRSAPSDSFLSARTSTSDTDGSSRQDASRPYGDAIVVASPETAARRVGSTNETSIVPCGCGSQESLLLAGGVSESVSLPLTHSRTIGGTGLAILPGGRVWDVSSRGSTSTSVMQLLLNSETPTDVELGVGLVPAYFPPSRIRRRRAVQTAVSVSSQLAAPSTRGIHGSGSGVISSALTVLSQALSKRPLSDGANGMLSVAANGLGPPPLYRISSRHGCGREGFSKSAGGMPTSSKSARYSVSAPRSGSGGHDSTRVAMRSARLSPWLLRPNVVPLSLHAVQHLEPPGSNSILALNTGGLHFFSHTTPMNKLATLLMRASNIGRDDAIRAFFVSFGYSEGCSMCLALATGSGSSDVLKRKAVQAALSHAHVPTMVPMGSVTGNTGSHAFTVDSTTLTGHTNGIAESFDFLPSSLYKGLVSLLSRLLRPIWYKPAVVVTEGRAVQRRSRYSNYSTVLPAKVELLLDESTLDEVHRPLLTLQNLMRDVFAPAVSVVPGVKKKQNSTDTMDIDDSGVESSSRNGQYQLISQAMQYQSQAASRDQSASQGNQPTAKELDSFARRTEERNLHSLYRLLSRSVQAVTLLSYLRRANSTVELPEVEWGLLHGLTYAQLVTDREAQQRVDAVLNSLVSIADPSSEGVYEGRSSVEADKLASMLSKKCYLYFSSGSRLTYLGFRSAHNALSHSLGTPRRVALCNQAAAYFRSASRHWYNPSLVTGRLLHRDDNTEGYEDVARRAMNWGSPLARSASILMELEDVGGIVDICLICASNFGGAKIRRDDSREDKDERIKDMLDWEKELYHHPPVGLGGTGTAVANGAGSTTSTSHTRSSSVTGSSMMVTGMDVTPADAIRTCRAIIFHYVINLLNTGGTHAAQLAETMVSVCASSSDVKFLHSFFELLLKSNHEDTMLRIDSPALEAWLHEKQTDNVALLWRYYVVHGRNSLAGEIMWKRACSPTSKRIRLDERIECLIRAANSFAAALKSDNIHVLTGPVIGGFVQQKGLSGTTSALMKHSSPTRDEIQKNIAQINEQLEIASMQRRVLTTTEQSQNVRLDASKAEALSYSLVNVSDLYNDYAAPLNLYDLILLILQTCHHNDAALIATLWKSVICEEIMPCETNHSAAQSFLQSLKVGSMLEEQSVILAGKETNGGNGLPKFENGDWIPRLKNRIVELGKELYGKGADYTFPLELIVECLEGLRGTYENSTSTVDSAGRKSPWPLQILIEIRVSFPALLEVYELLQGKEGEVVGGADPMKRVKRLIGVTEVLTEWIASASNRSALATDDSEKNNAAVQLSRAVSSGGLQSRIDAYKASLEGLVGGDANQISCVYSDLTDVEEALKRFA